MYNTEGVNAVATITELRAETSELIDHVKFNKSGILIQKNNAPVAVLLDWDVYKSLSKKGEGIELGNLEDAGIR